jgi:hypothetical protein
MKLFKKDLEISHTQLAYLFQNKLNLIEEFETKAYCSRCKSSTSIISYKIFLNQHDSVRLVGECITCHSEAIAYSFHDQDRWYKERAIEVQLQVQGIDYLTYLRERQIEDRARSKRKSWIRDQGKAAPAYYQIQVSLNDIRPKIWRRLLIQPQTSLPALHKILQISMGWTNSHLHQFKHEETCYGIPWDEDPEATVDYRKVKIWDLLLYPHESMTYKYDFGDSWEHEIKLEDILLNQEPLPFPTCTDGARNCPPEDCGGVGGYAALLKIIKNQKHPGYKETMMWLGGRFDPAGFDIDRVNRELAKRAKYRL